MTEELDESSSQSFDLHRYLEMARRRHLHFLIPLFVAWVLVWSASWILAPRYRSTTLILVEQPTMPREYVTPNVNDDLQERLQSITQQILSRTRLLRIIDQLGLYANAGSQPSPDQKVDRMRKEIEIDLVRDNRAQISAFNVSYASRDPRQAQKVTSELTNLFINENLEVRQQQSENTTSFLEERLETARRALAEQEDKVRQFKSLHPGELPGQVGSNLQILAGLQSQMQAEQDALNAAKQHRVYLETLLNQYRSMQGSSKAATGAPLGLAAIDQELEKLSAQLSDLRAHYTDRHPDVRKVQQQITETQRMRDRLVADLKTKSSGSAEPGGATALAEVPEMKDPSSPMAQLQGQLQSNKVEIANHENALESFKAKVAEYQNRLNQEPVREQQLADLTRGYEQSKANYDELLKKKNDSAMATSMELLQQGERFHIIDPPSLPVKPEFPNRLKFCGIGLGIGLALGVVVAGAFEALDDRVYDEKELQKLLSVPVISEIPAISSASDARRERRHLWIGWGATAFVSVTILVGSAISYLRG
jgi:polysaccharide biosynthesis transport protein